MVEHLQKILQEQFGTVNSSSITKLYCKCFRNVKYFTPCTVSIILQNKTRTHIIIVDKTTLIEYNIQRYKKIPPKHARLLNQHFHEVNAITQKRRKMPQLTSDAKGRNVQANNTS